MAMIGMAVGRIINGRCLLMAINGGSRQHGRRGFDMVMISRSNRLRRMVRMRVMGRCRGDAEQGQDQRNGASLQQTCPD